MSELPFPADGTPEKHDPGEEAERTAKESGEPVEREDADNGDTDSGAAPRHRADPAEERTDPDVVPPERRDPSE